MNNDEKNLNSASDENKSADTYMNVEENKTDRTDTEDNDGMNNIDKNNQSAGNEQHTSKTLKRKKGILKKISGAFRNPRKRKYAIVIAASGVFLIVCLTICFAAALLRTQDDQDAIDVPPETCYSGYNRIPGKRYH